MRTYEMNGVVHASVAVPGNRTVTVVFDDDGPTITGIFGPEDERLEPGDNRDAVDYVDQLVEAGLEKML